jgi:hypothetical protein
MGAYYPIFMGLPPHTAIPATAVVGGQLLEVAATGTVQTASAASASVLGVAAYDAAANAEVTVFRGGVQLLTANGTVTAGTQVEAAASGAVRTLASGRAIGVALTTATTGNPVQIALNA